jgi:hypothetical protein
MNFTSGSVTLPALTVTATGLSGGFGNVTVTLPALTISATGLSGGFGNASVTLPSFTVSATSDNQINVEVTLPLMTMSASGTAGATAGADLSIPALTVQGAAANRLNAAIPALTVEATTLTGVAGNLNRKIPALTVEATATAGMRSDLNRAIPALTSSGQGHQTNIGNADVTITALVVRSSHIQGNQGGSNVSIASLTLEATGWNLNTSDGNVTIPSLVMVGTLSQPADTYFKTVALNIRNLGNTEYSNFPFDSMAKLGDKTIGVDSNGIYEITGANDNAVDIDVVARLGFFDTEDEVFQRLVGSYLTYKTDGDVVVELVDENGTVRPHNVTFFQNKLMSRRVLFARNMQDRYYSYRVKNVTGSTLELNRVDLETIIVKEKV